MGIFMLPKARFINSSRRRRYRHNANCFGIRAEKVSVTCLRHPYACLCHCSPASAFWRIQIVAF